MCSGCSKVSSLVVDALSVANLMCRQMVSQNSGGSIVIIACSFYIFAIF
jgi:hypothetical protein